MRQLRQKAPMVVPARDRLVQNNGEPRICSSCQKERQAPMTSLVNFNFQARMSRVCCHEKP